jgi:uncharacterized membrane protein YgcG
MTLKPTVNWNRHLVPASFAIAGILPLVALGQATRPAARKPVAQPARKSVAEPAKPAIASVTVGAYTIAVQDVRRVDEKRQNIMLKPSGQPIESSMLIQGGGRRAESSSHSGGSASTGGHAGGAAAAGGGASSGTVEKCNLIVDLHLSRPGHTGQVLCTPVGRMNASDDQGKAVESSDLPPQFKIVLKVVDYPSGSGDTALHLTLKNKQAKALKTLAGSLVAVDARIQTVVFEGKDLARAVTRRQSGATVRLDKVETTDEGITVVASAPMPDPFNDQLNFHNMQNRLRIVLEDSQGRLHEPQSATGGSSGGGSGGGSSGTGPRRGNPRPSAEPRPMASMTARFAPLADGITIRGIRCTFTELTGQPQQIAFRFNDLPLPPG